MGIGGLGGLGGTGGMGGLGGTGGIGALLDLDYREDASCETDMNVVMTGAGAFVEVQGTAEGAAVSRADMDRLLDLAQSGIAQLMDAQRRALAGS